MKAAGLLTCFCFFLLSITPVLAQSKKSKPRKNVDTSKVIKIVYASSPWNVKSSQVDSAFLFLRDANTGKVVKIFLEETEPDSSTFAGQFSVNWANLEQISPEVYIPPQNLRNNEKALSEFNTLINNGRVRKQPVVYHKDENDQQIVDVYDTKDQAQRALEIYRRQQKELAENKKKLTQPATSESNVELAKRAEQQAVLAQLANEAALREAERIRIEQLERQKAEERKRKAESLAAAEKLRRKKQAEELARQGSEAYQKGDFGVAEEFFSQSLDLDPTNTNYYFMYGVALYRNEKMNEALVILKMAQDKPETQWEKKYYLGLIHFRLKELDAAIGYFREVKGANIPALSPSAAFYEGVILFNKEEFEKAKGPFEFVLDNSNDPAMDQRAEEYIEKIARIISFRAAQSKKHILQGTVGAMYDSNILLASDTVESQGKASGKGGFRTLASADYEYRFKMEVDREFSGKINAMSIYSLDSDFTQADPIIVNAQTPYSWKGTRNGRGYKLTLAPAFETLYMDAEDPYNWPPESSILNSYIFKTDLTLVMNPTWFANYVLEARLDNSSLASSIGDDDADAQKYNLKTTQMLFLKKDMKTAIMANAGLTLNQAKGENKTYQRIDLGVVYTAPFKRWDAAWNAGLSVYYLDYPDASGSDARTDQNVTFNLGASKPFKDWVTWGLNASYSNNQSTNTTNQYSKYTVMTTATFKWSK